MALSPTQAHCRGGRLHRNIRPLAHSHRRFLYISYLSPAPRCRLSPAPSRISPCFPAQGAIVYCACNGPAGASGTLAQLDRLRCLMPVETELRSGSEAAVARCSCDSVHPENGLIPEQFRQYCITVSGPAYVADTSWPCVRCQIPFMAVGCGHSGRRI